MGQCGTVARQCGAVVGQCGAVVGHSETGVVIQ